MMPLTVAVLQTCIAHACIKACVFDVGIGNVCVAATICYWLLTPYAFATGLATTILYSLFALQKMRLYHEGVLLGALIYHILVHKICCQKVDCIDICIPPNNPGMFGGVGQEFL